MAGTPSTARPRTPPAMVSAPPSGRHGVLLTSAQRAYAIGSDRPSARRTNAISAAVWRSVSRDDQRAVPGVVAHHRVVLPARGEPVEVVVDLADRAARVVLAGQHQDRRATRRRGRSAARPSGRCRGPRWVSRRTATGRTRAAAPSRPRTRRRSPRPGRPRSPTAQRSGCRPSPSSVRYPPHDQPSSTHASGSASPDSTAQACTTAMSSSSVVPGPALDGVAPGRAVAREPR